MELTGEQTVLIQFLVRLQLLVVVEVPEAVMTLVTPEDLEVAAADIASQ
jgi:hypothetical protein